MCLSLELYRYGEAHPDRLLSLVDLKYLAVHHFVELTYNGILRRLLVASARATPSAVDEYGQSVKPALTSNQVFQISRSTTILFKSPVAPLPKMRPHPASVATSSNKVDGELPGYESIGGMESQIEQIRELVEWPLTRPELYNHFGWSPTIRMLLPEPVLMSSTA